MFNYNINRNTIGKLLEIQRKKMPFVRELKKLETRSERGDLSQLQRIVEIRQKIAILEDEMLDLV